MRKSEPMKSIIRRSLLAAMLFATLAAQGQSAYPSKTIRMVIPLASGSAVDNAARILAQKMATGLGQAIVTENVPGSAGLIGADWVAKAAPDGYTIGGFNDSILTMVPNIYPKVPWNALTDFTPISLVATVEWGLIVKEASPFKTVADFIAAAKAAPGKLNYSSGGIGSPQHIAMALFTTRTGINVAHVPYKGATPGAVAVAAGEVDAGFQGLATAMSLIQSHRLRLLAVSTPKRLAQFPNVPTVDEAGVKDFFFNSWFAMVAPAGTPSPIIERLNAEMQKALLDPDLRIKFVSYGLTIRGSSAKELGVQTKNQFEMYRQLIKTNHISAD